TEFLEQAMVIGDRETPFGIVIAEKLRCGATPAAACFAIRADDSCHGIHPPTGASSARRVVFRLAAGAAIRNDACVNSYDALRAESVTKKSRPIGSIVKDAPVGAKRARICFSL